MIAGFFKESNMNYKINLIKSNRKTFCLEIKERGVLIVRAPKSASKKDIMAVVEKHRNWIEKKIYEIPVVDESDKFTAEELAQMVEDTKKKLSVMIPKYSLSMGVNPNRITIRNQRTRWGSCSSKGNLNFNCLLSLVPERVMEYVVVHELAHLIEMNHSKRFWKIVEEIIPDYKEQKRWLKENGDGLIRKL